MFEHLEVPAILPLSATTLDRVRVVDRPRFVAEIARRRLVPRVFSALSVAAAAAAAPAIDLLTAGIFAQLSRRAIVWSPTIGMRTERNRHS